MRSALLTTHKPRVPGRRAFFPQGAKIDAFRDYCAELGHEPGDVALAWVAKQPGVTAPIVGPRTLAQFAGSLAALDIELNDEAMRKLNEIFPGPGGQAPEAYAW